MYLTICSSSPQIYNVLRNFIVQVLFQSSFSIYTFLVITFQVIISLVEHLTSLNMFVQGKCLFMFYLLKLLSSCCVLLTSLILYITCYRSFVVNTATFLLRDRWSQLRDLPESLWLHPWSAQVAGDQEVRLIILYFC